VSRESLDLCLYLYTPADDGPTEAKLRESFAPRPAPLPAT
jgi:hypothetical protein